MPRRFNKAERDELLALITTSKKDDDEDVHEDEDEKGASVLDALESKHADVLAEPAQHNPELIVPPSAESQAAPCTHCGAQLAPFVVEHRLNCPYCGSKQQPIRWEGVMGSVTASPILPEQQFAPPVSPPPHTHPNETPGWGAVQPCRNCGHGMQTFDGQRGAMCPNCGNEEAIMAQGKVAEVSMPPQSAPYEQKETALPYNPGAYEGEVEGMHPAAQYTYQRAVAQGAAPQAAMAAAQEKQGEMMKRTQEGQNTEGVQIPVVNSSTRSDRDGFISVATIKRVSHLV
jgi:DNA-directed RNA polymerase subunit RPC12/RpoP